MTTLSEQIGRLHARYRSRSGVPTPLDHMTGVAQTARQALNSPITVQVDIIETCRQACVFCVQANRPGRTGQWSREQFAAFAADLAAAGVAEVIISGGEPGCHPELADILQSAKRHQLAVRLETTGIDLEASVLDVIAERFTAGQDRIVLSVDAATQPTYQRIRGVDGFAQLQQLLASLGRTRIPFATRTVIVPDNVNEVTEIALTAHRYGAIHSMFSPPHRAATPESARLSTAQTLASYQALLDLPAEIPLRLHYDDLDHTEISLRSHSDDLDHTASPGAYHCPAGLCSCSVDAHGNASICTWWSDHGRVSGRWAPGHFAELWRQITTQRSTLAAVRCCAGAPEPGQP